MPHSQPLSNMLGCTSLQKCHTQVCIHVFVYATKSSTTLAITWFCCS